MRFIHTADIHLDSPLQGLEAHADAPVEEIRGATRRAFSHLIELTMEEKVDFLLIAGDLYDGDWKDYNTGLFFATQMGRLAKAGIRVVIVSGNHDAASQITRDMPLPDNVTLLSSHQPQSVLFDDLGVIIHGQSYATRAVTDNLVQHYPQSAPGRFNIGLLHTSLNGREGHEAYAPCSPDELKAKGYDYWALGHVHTREVVCRDPWIVFPGNIQGRHIRETGVKSVTLVTVEEDRITEVEPRPLDVLRWSICPVDLSGCEGREQVYERVRTAMEEEQGMAEERILVLRLLLTGICPLHADLHARAAQWLEEFRGLALGLGEIWLEKVLLRTHRQRALEEIMGADTPLSGLMQAIEGLEFGPGAPVTLVPEFAGLKAKLPAELLDQLGTLADHPCQAADLREEIKELLLARLIRQGGGE